MMNSKASFGYREAVALTVAAIIAKVFLGYPSALIDIGGSATWMIPLLSSLTAIVGFLILSTLLERFPGKTIIEIAEIVGGPAVCYGTSFIIFTLIAFLSGLTLREFSENALITALPETPPSAVMILYAVCISFAVYLGIEALARASYVLYPFIVFMLLLIIFSLFGQWNSNFIFPIFGKGLDKLASSAIYRVGDYWEVLLLAIITPTIYKTQSIRRIGIISIIIASLVFCVIQITSILSLSSVVAEEPYVIMYKLTRVIYLSRFVQRVESVFVLLWTVVAFLHLAIALYLMITVIAETFRISDKRPLILPSVILILTIAFIPEDLPLTYYAANRTGPIFAGSVYFGLPFILLLISMARRKRGETDEAN